MTPAASVDPPRVPRRCHGRETALGELFAAFEIVSRGGCHLLLVSGEAGVGKTSLVNELQQHVALRAGRFVRGKCEQYQRHRPLLAPVQALRQLLTRLMADRSESLRTLSQRMQHHLGPEAAALQELLPELASLTGEVLTPPTALDPRESQIRLTGLLVQLVRLISSPSHPLVLVLDDLQWADQPTLDFLSALLDEEELDGILLAGLYRREELENSPALRRLVEKATATPGRTTCLHLYNLGFHGLMPLLGEMLGTPPGEIRDLTAEIHRATRGNPFHTIELLQSLHREGALQFDPAGGRWTCDLSTVAKRPSGDDVVAFLRRGLSDLPAATCDALVVTACLGADTTPELVARAMGFETNAAVSALQPAWKRGVLVAPGAEGKIKGYSSTPLMFCHDRMQQAAIGLREEAWRHRLQLDMARRLAAPPTDARLRYRAAEHYAEVTSLVQDPVEKEKVAALFLESGRTACAAGAFVAARRFLRLGLDLLSPDPWAAAPVLAWNLHTELHTATYCIPDYGEADAVYAELQDHSPGPFRLAAPASIQVMSLSNRTRYEEAVRLGARLLRKLGIDIPLNDPEEPLERELAALFRALDDGVLERLPGPCGHPGPDHAAARLMNRMIPAAFFCLPNVANWLVVYAAQQWIAGHYDEARIYPLACLMLATIPSRGDYLSGYRAAQAALSAGEAYERGVETARARHVFGLFNCHWFEPLEHGLAQAREAHDALLRNGELEFACYTYFTSQAALLDTCETLQELADENRRALAFADNTGNRHARESYTAYSHLIAALTSAPDDTSAMPAGNPMAACFHHMARGLVAALFGQDQDLAHHAAAAARLSPYITGFYPTALINILESLALLARRRSGDNDPGIGTRLTANQEWLTARAAEAPANFAHLHDLIAAETLAIEGHTQEALPVYERAIRRAKAHRRPWHTAWATEKAARCYLALDLKEAARRLLEQAHALYADWGALGKCAALEEEFPVLKSAGTDLAKTQPLLAAMQQLASIRSVPQLAATTAEIFHQISGATDVQILVLDDQDRWMLKAGFADGEPLPRLTLEEAQQSKLVSTTVVQLGLRLLRPILSEDAVLDSRFAGDPRFKECQSCAVLGIPVVSRNRALAFVLLENRRLSGAFNRELAEIVTLLCGQLAVSIENARLYRLLEDEVEQRTRELRAAEQTLAQTAYELTENIPVGTYTMVQPPGGGMAYFSFMSTRFLELTGLDREAGRKNTINALNAFPCVHPDDYDEWARKNAYVFEHKLPFKEECRVVVQGRTRWITAESTPRDLPDGSVVWEGVLTDITARKKAENELRETTRRMTLAASAAGIGFWSRDLASGLEEWDDQMLVIYGIRREDFEGRWQPFVHPDDFGGVVDSTARALEQNATGHYEYRIIRPDGKVRYLRGMSVAVRGERGELLREIGVNFDITEEKEVAARQKQLEEQHRRELEAKLKTSLAAAAVAHEINQPLSILLLQSKMALHQEADPVESLSIVAQEAQRVVVTIEKMKTLLRNVQTEHHPVDLAEVVSSALLYNKGLIERHGINLRRRNLEQPCLIEGDGAQLQLAFNNLIRNAVEAIEAYSPSRREILVEIVTGEKNVEFVIGDTGPGWSGAEKIESHLTTTKKGGTGIGLYVVRTAMENHRGHVQFGPSPLGGAEARLRFARKCE